MPVVPLHTEDADGTLLHAFDESPVGWCAATAATGPRTLLLRAVVGLAVEVPQQGKVFVGNLLQTEGCYVVEGGWLVVRPFLEVGRDGVVASFYRHRGGLVALRVGVPDAVVAHALEPVYPYSLRTTALVALLI